MDASDILRAVRVTTDTHMAQDGSLNDFPLNVV